MQKRTINLLVGALFVAGLFILGLASRVWYTNIHLDPERTFWASIDNALTAGSFTKSGTTIEPVTKQTISQNQTLSFVGNVVVKNDIQVLSSDGKETIEVETLGFKDADFFRYSTINLSDKEQSEKAQDAVNVWASNGPEEVELLLESLASSFVLYGNFNYQDKADIYSKLTDGVYTVDFDNIPKVDNNGRTVYVYRANIDLKKFSKAFASYVSALGNETLAANIESADYRGTSVIDISIDARSRQLISVVDINAEPTNERIVVQGVEQIIEKPENPLKFSELQARLDD